MGVVSRGILSLTAQGDFSGNNSRVPYSNHALRCVYSQLAAAITLNNLERGSIHSSITPLADVVAV